MPTLRCACHSCWLVLLALLTACSNGTGSLDEPAAPPAQGAQDTFSIGGSVTGLAGSGLTLQLNGGGDLAIAADGTFTFASRLVGGASYIVTVRTQPSAPAQACTVSNGSGSVAANVANVAVSCRTGQFSVSGNVTGLTGSGLVLQNNGGDDLGVNASGAFTFAGLLADGATYNVTVRSQPAGQNCVVRNAAGTIAAANITNLDVSCASNQFTIGGTVSGLAGTGLVLQLNGANDRAVVSNGQFAFAAALAAGATYAVSIRSQPASPTQACTISNGSGTVTGNVTNVAVTCVSSSFSVGGTVNGLSGSGLTLQLNGGDNLGVSSNGSFTFANRLTSGERYRVSVLSQPSNPPQTCTIAGAEGTVGNTSVTSVRVTCASSRVAIGGTVNGLLGSGLVLQNNGADDLSVTANGSFVFRTTLASGATYNVTVRSQPSNPQQACSVRDGRGTAGSADVTRIVVSCTTGDFTIGGTVENLAGSGLVLRNNGADELTIDSSGPFAFDTALPVGAHYSVTVAEQPTDPTQSCAVSNGAGVVGFTNVTNVIVRCSTAGFLVGGRVRGLRGSGLLLQNNGADDLAIASDGRFRFSTPVSSGGSYNVTVARQPSDPEQRCTVDHGSGTVDHGEIDNIDVRCRRDHDDDD